MGERRRLRSLIALLAVALVAVWGGTAFAASHEAGESSRLRYRRGGRRGTPGSPRRVRFPGIITDSMLLNAGKDPNNWILYGKDYSHTRYSQLDEINTETIKDLVPKWVAVVRHTGQPGQPDDRL